MVSVEKIAQKFILLDDYLETLNEISRTSKGDFLQDKILIGSAKHYLQVSIECCLDVANHIIATEHFRSPKDYADTFSVLFENGLLTESHCNNLRQMAKFRNRIVHLYGEIDNTRVYDILGEDLTDIHQFKTIILKHYHP